MSKSKSSSQLLPLHSRRANRTLKPLKQKQKQDASAATSTDWLLRAGAALASEARESKGQSWLASRDSATSLTGYGDDESRLREDSAFADDECSPVSTRHSRAPSFSSRKHSRRGSRALSRAELRSAAGTRTPGRVAEDEEKAFDDEFAKGPDFVDAEVGDDVEQGDEEQPMDDAQFEDEIRRQLHEDAEMDRLTRQAGALSFGGWLDHLIDWSLFSGIENDTESTAAAGRPVRGENEKPTSPLQLKSQDTLSSTGLDQHSGTTAPEGETITSTGVPREKRKPVSFGGKDDENEDDDDCDDCDDDEDISQRNKEEDKSSGAAKREEEGQEGGDLDMAWLMSVATKVLF